MIIRNFVKSDLNKIMRFKRQSVKISFPKGKMDEGKIKKKILSHAERDPNSIRVVEKDGKIIGYIWFSVEKNYLGKYGLIHHVFIDDKYRGFGLARKLMKIAEKYLKTKGIKKIKVTVTLTNLPSLRMCKKLGYKKTRVIMERFV